MAYDIEDREYWDKRSAKIDADAAADAEYRQSVEGRLEMLGRKIDAMRADNGARTATETAAVEAQYDALKTEIEAKDQAAFAAEWTAEVTTSRRAAWNGLVKSGKLSKTGKLDWAAIRAQEKAQGWTMDALKKAVQMHGM